MQILRSFVYGLFLMYVVSLRLASAASFECSPQTTQRPVDLFICSNSTISLKDELMATTYQKGFKALSPKARVAYLNSQRSWLAAWPRNCLKSMDPPKANQLFTRDFIECAQRQYDERMPLLTVQEIGPFKTYTIAKYNNVKVKNDGVPSAYKAVNHQLSYPQVDEATSASNAPQVNAWINQTMRKFGLKHRASLNEDDMISSLDIEMTQQTADIYGLKLRYVFDGFGAHPNSVIQRFQWMNTTNRPLVFQDVFKNTLWVADIAEQLTVAFREKYEGMFLVTDKNSIHNAILDMTHWEFSKEGLTLHFMPYELTAYAAGAPEFFIPKKVVESFLTPFALEQMQ